MTQYTAGSSNICMLERFLCRLVNITL